MDITPFDIEDINSNSRSQNRIAIIDSDKCKPTKCKKECTRYCPPNQQGKECIVIDYDNKGSANEKKKIAIVNEELCISCGACVKKCPFEAVKIIRLAVGNKEDLIHSYGKNKFRLYKFPILKKNKIIAFIAPNGLGKTSCLDILSGNFLPNLGKEKIGKMEGVREMGEDEGDDMIKKNILKKFRGTEIQKYFTSLFNGDLTFSYKEQFVDRMMTIMGDLQCQN